jgi:DnaK suppressor protein
MIALRKEKLLSMQQQLLTRREGLVRDLSQATADLLNQDEDNYTDSIDQASADIDRGLTLQMKNREHEVLAQIDAALRRIELGSFGICDQCSGEIGEARMAAHPETILCIECKAELESEQRRVARAV